MGVVGVLQFDVLKYRLENEYNVDIRLDMLPYEHIRWIENTDLDLDRLVGTSDMKKIKDLKGRPCCCLSTAGPWEWCWTGIRPAAERVRKVLYTCKRLNICYNLKKRHFI